MNITEQLTLMEGFSASEIDLAKYILKNKEEVLSMSVQELSKKTFTSTSSVVRLCRKIGLDGFSNFKILFSAELQKNNENKLEEINANFPFDSNDSFFEITKKLHNLLILSLNETYNALSYNDFKIAMNLLQSAERIACFGGGENFTEILNFQNRMMKINRNILVPYLPFDHNQLACNLTSKDCAIIVSYSGEIEELKKLPLIFKMNNVPIVAITARPKSTIGEAAKAILSIGDLESQSIKFTTFSSCIGVEFILNSIYSYFFVKDYDANAYRRVRTETYFLNSRVKAKPKK